MQRGAWLWRLVVVAGLVALPLSGALGNASEESVKLGGLRIGGHINSIASRLDQNFTGGGSEDTGAVDVNSLELGVTASPLRYVDASVVFLMEEGLDSGRATQDIDVDQAFVVLAGTHRVLADRPERRDMNVSPWYFKLGKFYSPFATQMDYHTFDVISEPQTLALGETLESTWMVGVAPSDHWRAYAGAFSGDGGDTEAGRGEDADLDDAVVGVDWTASRAGLSVQWTNNINNSIALIGELGRAADENGGVSLYGRLEGGSLLFQAAYVTVTDDYRAGPLAGLTPDALTLELTGRGLVRVGGRPLDATLVYEQTDEWVDHPETVRGAVVDVGVLPGVTGSLEYIDRDYDPALSTRLDDEELVSARVSVEFAELVGSDA